MSSGSNEPPEAHRQSAAPASLLCHHCGLGFRRREHLSRHLDRHSGVRPHACDICNRSFPRRDTLKRHMSTHGSAALAEWTQHNEHSHRHACCACAKGKQRCDGGVPSCSNCSSRGRVCVYRDGSPKTTSQHAGDHRVDHAERSPVPGSDARPPASNAPREADSAMADGDCRTPKQAAAGMARPAAEHRVVTTDHQIHHTRLLPTQQEPPPWNELLSTPHLMFPYSPIPLLGIDDASAFCFGNAVTASSDALHPDGSATDNYGHLAPPTPATSHLHVTAQQDVFLAEDEDVLSAEHLPHVMQVPAETRACIVSFIEKDLPQNEAPTLASAFPSLRHLDVYVQLYFEHYHPRVPFLHVPTFRTAPECWQLVLAVACIGCQYSAAHQKPRHLALFNRLSQHMLQQDVRHFETDTLTCTQSLLLFHHELWFSGQKAVFVHLQLYRNMLMTLCRQLLSQDATLLRSDPQPEQSSDPWLQWVRGEAKRRVLYFTWMTECFHTLFFLLPPLMSMHELQISLPDHEAHWQADHPQWKYLPPPQPQWPLCSVLARIGRETSMLQSLGASARLILLLSASVQQVAAENLRRAMMLPSGASDVSHAAPDAGSLDHLQRTALEALLRHGCAQPLNPGDASSITCDYAITARVLRILDFTSAQVLFAASRWQTTESGASRACSELSEVFGLNVSRARRCMFEAAQLFQYFRTIKALSHIDMLSLLVSTLYMFAYIELAMPLQTTLYDHGDARPLAKLIRLDQAISDEDKEDWLSLRSNCRLHLVGIGLLEADRSSARLFKEAARIMSNSASTSRLAGALSIALTSQAMGDAPKLPDDQ